MAVKPLIEVNALSLKLPNRFLVNELAWSIYPGQVWAIIGVNGCGKSSLLRLLAGLTLSADISQQGLIKWGEESLHKLKGNQRASKLAWMAQADGDAFSMSVGQRVMAGMHKQGYPWRWETSQQWSRVESALAKVDLPCFSARPLASLSGGEQRRVSLAAAMVQDAQITLLDEPMSQLDWTHQVLIGEVFKSWPNLPEKALVWVTHEPNMALRFSTHMLAIGKNGQCWQGPVCELAKADVLREVYGCDIESSADPFLFFPKC